MREFWSNIFDFLGKAGVPPPESRAEAIVFNLWTDDKLGPVLARAIVRHAYRQMYTRFAKVDTCGCEFCCIEATIATLESVRRALVRRAVRVKSLHAARLHTGKPDRIPKEAAEKFASLINMSPCGDYGLTPVIPRLLARYKAALHTKTERNKSYSKSRRPGKRKRT